MHEDSVEQETNRLVRAWISFWYHDMTRMLLVLFGGHLLATVPLLYSLGLSGELLRTGSIAAYLGVLVWALIDNDFGQLRRIGLDEYRKPLVANRPSARIEPTW